MKAIPNPSEKNTLCAADFQVITSFTQPLLFVHYLQRFDVSRNYMDCDTSLMMTTLEHGLNHLATCWGTSGRPLITLILGDNMLDNGRIHPAMMSTLKKLSNGYISGAR